jgi:membrane associated rhomboid family serine protease
MLTDVKKESPTRGMWPTRGLPARTAPVVLVALTLVQMASFAFIPQEDLALVVRAAGSARDGATAVSGAFTSLFAHADAAHLAANVVGTFLVGTWVEALHGHVRVLVLYVTSGVGGAMGFRAWRCASTACRASGTTLPCAYLVGASSAVYGLVGSAFAHLLVNWSELPFACLWLTACVLALSVEVTAYVVAPVESVAYSAHAAGAVWGLGLGVLVLRNARLVPRERVYRAVAAVGLVVAGAASIVACA